MQLHEAQAPGTGTLTAGDDGRILLSTDASASVLAGVEDAQGRVCFRVGTIRVGAGQSLVVRSPDGRPAQVVAEVLEVGDGGRVVLETYTELNIGRAAFGAPSEIVLVGKDGGAGTPGEGGAEGSYKTRYSGGNGGGGGPGDKGDPGPGGKIFSEQISGQVRIVAGGGNGGPGGPGGAGGAGRAATEGFDERLVVGNGGNGGPGGPGGRGGDGGTVVLAFGTMASGSSVQAVTRYSRGGAGGKGGTAGGAEDSGRPGIAGSAGDAGADGDPPVFVIRPRD